MAVDCRASAERQWAGLADDVRGSVVIVDDLTCDSLGWNVGGPFLFELGALNVLALSKQSTLLHWSEACCDPLQGATMPSRLLIITASCLFDVLQELQDVVTCPLFCRCPEVVIITTLSEAGHMVHPVWSSDSPGPKETLATPFGVLQRSMLDEWNLGAEFDCGTDSTSCSQTADVAENPFKAALDDVAGAGASENASMGAETPKSSKQRSVIIKHSPLMFTAVSPQVFLLPSCDTVYPLDMSQPCLQDPCPSWPNLSAEQKEPVRRVSYALSSVIDALDVKVTKPFVLGHTSDLIGHQIPLIVGEHCHSGDAAEATLILVDRSLDLAGPCLHSDNLIDRICTLLPHMGRNPLNVKVPYASDVNALHSAALAFDNPADTFSSCDKMESISLHTAALDSHFPTPLSSSASFCGPGWTDSLPAGNNTDSVAQTQDGSVHCDLNSLIMLRHKDACLELRRGLMELIQSKQGPEMAQEGADVMQKYGTGAVTSANLSALRNHLTSTKCGGAEGVSDAVERLTTISHISEEALRRSKEAGWKESLQREKACLHAVQQAVASNAMHSVGEAVSEIVCNDSLFPPPVSAKNSGDDGAVDYPVSSQLSAFAETCSLIVAMTAILGEAVQWGPELRKALERRFPCGSAACKQLPADDEDDQERTKQQIIDDFLTAVLPRGLQSRARLQDYSSLVTGLQFETSVAAATPFVYRPLLVQMMQHVLCCQHVPLTDLRFVDMDVGVGNLLATGFSAITAGFGFSMTTAPAKPPHPLDNNVIIVFVVGGITNQEIQMLQDVLKAANSTVQLVLGSTTIASPSGITRQLMSR